MNSGIIRKIDELGRIVIPIEIRKILNINVGENLEFIVNDNNIIIKKNNVINNYSLLINEVGKTLASIIDGDILITDREKVIYASESEYLNCYLSDEVISLLNNIDEYAIVNNIFMKNNVKNKTFYIYPYYYENNICGFIILYSIDSFERYYKLLKFISNYLHNNITLK